MKAIPLVPCSGALPRYWTPLTGHPWRCHVCQKTWPSVKFIRAGLGRINSDWRRFFCPRCDDDGIQQQDLHHSLFETNLGK